MWKKETIVRAIVYPVIIAVIGTLWGFYDLNKTKYDAVWEQIR